jgi:hypothetical protein
MMDDKKQNMHALVENMLKCHKKSKKAITKWERNEEVKW